MTELREVLAAHQPKEFDTTSNTIKCSCGETFGWQGGYYGYTAGMMSSETLWNVFVAHQSSEVNKSIKLAVPGEHSPIVIVDIDGVLADNTKHLPQVKEKGWEWFGTCLLEFGRLPLWPDITTILHQQGFRVWLLTNRPEEQQPLTEAWLRREGVEYSELFMWKTVEPQKGHKERYLQQWLVANQPIVFAVDDDPEHISMYEAYGIPAVHVDSGYHDVPGSWDPPKESEDAALETA